MVTLKQSLVFLKYFILIILYVLCAKKVVRVSHKSYFQLLDGTDIFKRH